jgi:hypothetical protein
VEVLGILGGVEIALREMGVEVRAGAGPAAASSWLAESGARGAASAAGSSGVGRRE